jgi:hypothetical protein
LKNGLLLSFLVLSLHNGIWAQSNFLKNLSLRIDGRYGFVIPEYKHFIYLVEKPVTGIEISLTKRTSGKSYWEQLYKYPEIGLTFLYTTLGNRDVFGNEFALYPYVQTFLIRKPKFQFTIQFGLGFGYATKKFDLETAYENVSIGSHFNIHFNNKLGTRFQLTKKLSLNTGLSFDHYSNMNMAEPNLGINLFTAFAGFNYCIGEQTEFTKTEIPQHDPKNEFAFIYAAGGKHTRALQSKVYFTSSVSAEYKFHWKRKIHFGGGLDLFYDSSTKTEMSTPGKNDYKSIYDFRTGLHFSQELVYDRFSFILQEGIYVGLIDRVDKSFMYNRAILRWKLNNHFLISVSMRSHLHILDYPEIGFGYYFIKKK